MIDRNIRIKDIAEAAGVSPATVSRVINNTGNVSNWTRTTVLRAVSDAGIELPDMAKELPLGTSASFKTIIIAVPDNNNNPFYSAIISGISESTLSKGYVPIVYTSPVCATTYERLLDYAAFIKAAGIISLYRIDELVSVEIGKRISFVQCCSRPKDPSIPYVCVNDKAAAKLAVQHLIRMGRHKIAIFAHSTTSRMSLDRTDGYYEAMNEAGLSVPDSWVFNIPHINFRAAYSASKQLFNREYMPNAIFAITDIAAIAILNAAKDSLIKVPEDVMIVGFDNLDMSEMTTPGLTTINQPRYEIGYAAGEMIHERITNPDIQPNNVLFDCQLVVRGSTSLQ